MPNIKPFNALIPASHLQAQVVTRPLENYSTGEAKLIASEHDCSFLHLINPELDNPYLRGTRQELIFKKIGENLDTFLDQQILIKQEPPAIFIYRVRDQGLIQTGIWTLTSIQDYLDGQIKKHEHTVERRERLLAEYLLQTRLDANPVLITYPPDPTIDALIEKYEETTTALIDFTFVDGSRHELWAITAKNDLKILISAFASMPCVYIADGHHRIASMAKLGLNNFFTSVYMNTKEVKVLAFNRLVRDLGAICPEQLLEKISGFFEMEKVHVAVEPQQLHEIGMYIKGQWYRLKPKEEIYKEMDPVECLDVSILQDFILGPLLAIQDPRTDARITFSGGRIPVDHLQRQVDNELFALAFTLFPVSMAQIMKVADVNGVMPPKSTWVEPKFLVGLITNHFI